MPIVLSVALVELFKKLSIFVTISLFLLLLPSLMGGMGGVSLTSGNLSLNVLSPLTNILAMAPEGLRWFIWYTHTDTALVMTLSAAAYGFLKDILFAAA